jgi:uncharacterized protein (TIGR02145 family)
MKNTILIILLAVCYSYSFAQQSGTLIDPRDGKTYKKVKIGSQVWMAENLAFHYGSGCWVYGNGLINETNYGYLYNWETAQNVCPAGWHLPSDEEWKQLEMYLGMSSSDVNSTGYHSTIGNALKSTYGWSSGGNGTNSSGFNALPGGYRLRDGSFYGFGTNAFFWSSSANGPDKAWDRNLHYAGGKFDRYNWYRSGGHSVRCLHD